MNIEKIKNYNQKMLAIIATAAVAFTVIGLFSFIFFLFSEVFRVFDRNTSNYQDEGLPTDEVLFTEQEKEIPKLFVSYHFPRLIDTINQIFVIPVSHQTEDEIKNDYSRKLDFSGLGSYEGYDYSYNSTHVNLLIYNAVTNENVKLFRQPIIIGEFKPTYFEGDILLLFEAADKDTDNNGKINLNDNTSLFIYSVTNKTLRQTKMDGMTVLHYQFIAKTKNLIVRFGANPNKRQMKNEEFDPGVLCKYNYEKDQLIEINTKKLNTELKEIAGGETN